MKLNIKLKNIVAAIVLVLFTASILPAAMADEEKINSPAEQDSLTEQGVLIKKKEAQEAQQQALRERGDLIKKKEAQEALETGEIRQQKLLQEKKKDMVERAQHLKEVYQTKKKTYLENRETLQELRRRAACKADTEACKLEKQDFHQGVQEHLLKTLNLIDASLERLVQHVESSPLLTDEERQEAVTMLLSWEERLNAKRAELEALDGDGITRRELSAQTKELKKLWHEVRIMQRKLLTSMITARHENIVDTYLGYGDKLEARIGQLKTEGADIREAQALLADYRQKVEEVKIASSEAKLAWQEAKVQGTKEALQAAREKQDLFRKVSVEAKQVLRELLQELRELHKLMNAPVAG